MELISNRIGSHEDDIKYLGLGLSKLVNLRKIDLYLSQNDIGPGDMEFLFDGFK